jgi:hypothetical protein
MSGPVDRLSMEILSGDTNCLFQGVVAFEIIQNNVHLKIITAEEYKDYMESMECRVVMSK